MATYKVIQDIEAEDKLLGPLSLRQFIYALIAVACLWFAFQMYTRGVPFLMPVFILPALFAAFFAVPWSKTQPTEIWALAKIRFFFKPRKRIWDQSGVKELVTITAPKKVEKHLTDGLNQGEVSSRLEALASTLDSRGWAVKNVNVNLAGQAPNNVMTSDRLLDVTNMPQEVPNYTVTAADDILDELNNPVAQQFESMIETQTRNHRAQIMQHMQQAAAGQSPQQAPQPTNDYWFMNQGQQASLQEGQAQFMSAPAIMPGTQINQNQIATTPEEEAIAARAKAANLQTNDNVYGRLHKLNPIGDRPVLQPAPINNPALVQEVPKAVTPQTDPAILNFATRDDLDVATIARQAKKAKEAESDEVVISLR